MEDRQTHFETQLSFLEKTVSELNEVVYQQQKEIDRLSKLVDRQESRLEALRAESEDLPQIPPPHY